jgi:hypothetical protein
MAVDGRPSMFLCWLACARSSCPRIAPRARPSRAPSSAYDAHGPPSRIVMPACQGAPTHRVSRPDHRLAATIRFMLPPNAPWGRSVSEAREAYSLRPTLSRALSGKVLSSALEVVALGMLPVSQPAASSN